MNTELRSGPGTSAEVRALIELPLENFDRLTVKLSFWLRMHGVEVTRMTLEKAMLDMIEAEVLR